MIDVKQQSYFFVLHNLRTIYVSKYTVKNVLLLKMSITWVHLPFEYVFFTKKIISNKLNLKPVNFIDKK